MKTQLRQARHALHRQEIFKVLQRTRSSTLLYRGKDSSDTVRLMSLEVRKAGYPQRCFIGCMSDASRLRHHPVVKGGAGCTVRVAAERPAVWLARSA